jgi:hypothetical protein
MKNAVAAFEQLVKQNGVTGVTLGKLQVATRRAPSEIVEGARAQVVNNDDLVPAPA